jgi:hypothetical protein
MYGRKEVVSEKIVREGRKEFPGILNIPGNSSQGQKRKGGAAKD